MTWFGFLQVEAAINRHRPQLLEERYRFNMGLLMGEQGLGQWTMLFSLVIPSFLGINEREEREEKSILKVVRLGPGAGS